MNKWKRFSAELNHDLVLSAIYRGHLGEGSDSKAQSLNLSLSGRF